MMMPEKYVKIDSIEKIFKEACDECLSTCIEFDGFFADCSECIFNGVKENVFKLPVYDIEDLIEKNK